MILYAGTCFSAAAVIVVDGEDEGQARKDANRAMSNSDMTLMSLDYSS